MSQMCVAKLPSWCTGLCTWSPPVPLHLHVLIRQKSALLQQDSRQQGGGARASHSTQTERQRAVALYSRCSASQGLLKEPNKDRCTCAQGYAVTTPYAEVRRYPPATHQQWYLGYLWPTCSCASSSFCCSSNSAGLSPAPSPRPR